MRNISQKRYAKFNVARYSLGLVRSRDADIISVLDAQPNKQGYIKAALREKIAKENASRTDGEKNDE